MLFTGDLYSTTGPYYGGSFNSGAVGYAKVGTLTFDADTVNTARLSYSVNGVPVAKNVTRQTWRNENLSGSYYGGNVGEQTSCGADTGHYEEETFIQINHAADNSITMTWTDLRNRSMNVNGTYSQSGHMGQIRGTASSALGSGTNQWTMFEIERTINGITGRLNGEAPGSTPCKVLRRYDGRFGGVRR